MKNLITLLIVLLSILGYTQELQWLNIDSVKSRNYEWYVENKESVELEFVRLIDSARQSNVTKVIYKEKYYVDSDPYITVLDCDRDGTYPSNKVIKKQYKIEKNNPDNDNVKLIKNEGFYSLGMTKSRKVNHIVYDSIMTLAAEHHVKYGFNIQNSKFYLNHIEGNDIYTDVTYNGDLPILRHPKDRVEYYCENRYYKGECLYDDPTNDVNVTNDKFLYQKTPSVVAYQYFTNFKESAPHWKNFMKEGDVNYLGVYYGMDKTTNRVLFNSIMGNEKNNKES